MALTKGFVSTAGTTALDARMMDAAKVVRTNTGAVRTGVLWTSAASGNVVGSTSSMNVTIVTADFVLSRGQTDGAVVLSNSGSTSVLLDVAPSANSRIDVVWVKQNDTESGDPDSSATFGKTTGNAAASPTKPSIPVGALELATVLVPAGVTATNASGVVVSNTFQYSATYGGPVRYRTEDEMRADSTVPDGIGAFVTGGGSFYRRSGYWTREDATTFAVVQAQTDQTLNSGTTLATIGGQAPRYDSSDATLLPSSVPTIGPLALSGWYEVSATVNWTSNSTGLRHIEITDNDASFNPPAADERSATTGTSNAIVTAVLQFSAGDYVKLKAWQNSGTQLSYRSRLSVKLLRAN